MNAKTVFLRATFVSLFVLVLSGCSSGSKRADGPTDQKAVEAAAHSQVYLEQSEFLPAGGKLIDVAKCVVPAVAEKPAPGQGTGPSKNWRNLIDHANGCVQEKNWKKLDLLAAAMARLDIDSPWGAYFLSVAAEGIGEHQRALWMIDLAQKKAGKPFGLFAYHKGRILFALGEIPRSMKEIERAVKAEPKLVEGHLFLAEIHQRDLEWEQAATSYQAALAGDEVNLRALSGLAEVKLMTAPQGNRAAEGIEKAAELYTRAVASHPENFRAWTRLIYISETLQKSEAKLLVVYKGMKASIDKGQIHDHIDFDLSGKIKTLEEALRPRVPAEAKKGA